MASDSSGGLHYSGDVTVEITDPQLTFSNPHVQASSHVETLHV